MFTGVPSIRVLGPLRLEGRSGSVRIAGHRKLTMLSMLILAPGRRVTSGQLTEALWERPPNSARQQIHNTVRLLRQDLAAIPDIDLVFDGTGYMVDAPTKAVDLWRFNAIVEAAARLAHTGQTAEAVRMYAEAVALWHGDAFEGMNAAPVAPALGELTLRHVSAWEELAKLRLRSGTSDSDLCNQLSVLVSRNPLRESSHLLLMEALVADGRQADALMAYEECRRYLAAELGVDPGDELKALHRAILRGQPTSDREPYQDRRPAVSSATTSPDSLPASTGSFIGREAQLRILKRVCAESSATALAISALSGMGGIGKTTLAVRLAHDLKADYPDGQYFINLNGFTPGLEPITARRALLNLLSQAGLPIESIPRDTDAASATWRAQLAGKRCLLLLDNVASAEQVRPLLPGSPGNLVIMTSRLRLGNIDGSHSLALDVLDPAEAVTLFLRINGRERCDDLGEVERVVDLCGRLPLAIRIAAVRFKDKRGWTLAELGRRLSDQRSRERVLIAGDRNVFAALEVSYPHLTEAQQRLFRLLSVHFAAVFGPTSCAALVGDEVGSVEDDLNGLFDASVLSQNESGCYEIHDLMRDAARRLSDRHDTDEERTSATVRLIDHYLQLAVATLGPLAKAEFAYFGISRDPEASRDGKADLAKAIEAYPAFAAAITAAERLGLHDRVWRLICALQPLFSARNYGGDAANLFRLAVRSAQACGDEIGEAIASSGLAVASRERADTQEALRAFGLAIGLSERLGRSDWLAFQLSDLGVMHLNSGQLGLAAEVFERAIAHAERAGDKESARGTLVNLAVVARQLGNFDDSYQHLRRAEQMSGGGEHVELVIALHLGYTLALTDRTEEALEYFGKSLGLAENLNLPVFQAAASCGDSGAARRSGDHVRAIRSGRAALALTRTYSSVEVECEALLVLGEAFLAAGEPDRAVELLNEASRAAETGGFINLLGRAVLGLAHVAVRRGDDEERVEILTRSDLAGVTDAVVSVSIARHLSNVSTCFYCASSADISWDAATRERVS
ncbi:BTAD domain-containing putative transcriptional regulator [Actinoplanes sp. NPDC048796]|uniref:AfsR/SARP family transcriptional regulator n=1 Tax=unclassified Actinoplanes TaxID=2626549 RepID=UPI0034035C61